jgi:arylsulfatase
MNEQKNNVLILFTDMQRADTIHALGNPTIRTPNLDRLAREGTAFTRCFSPSPVCIPARCCMHYGIYPEKTGLFDNGRMMDDNGRSYPAVLGAQGYRTHSIGKCHFTPDANALRGFQSREIQEEGCRHPERDDYLRWLKENGYNTFEPHGARGEMYYIPQVSTLPAAAHPSQWIGDRTSRFIAEATADRRPWCLFSSFIHPHPPFAPPIPWHKLYRSPDMPLPFLPENADELLTWINRYQNRYKHRDRGFDFNLLRVIKAYYYATLSFVDYQIGRILQTLEESGQMDRTLILFTSDHGEHLGDLGCFGKRSMHDASARVPLLARLPGRFAAGQRADTAVSLCDVFPTLLGACGIEADGLDLAGDDLAAIARRPEPDRVVHSLFEKGASLIAMSANARWKYVYSAGDRREWLFDSQNDPRETRSLADDDASASVKQELKTKLLEPLAAAELENTCETRNGTLDWMAHERKDEEYLRDPDAGLLFQDSFPGPLNLPGYTA